jgi:hypothetical protein
VTAFGDAALQSRRLFPPPLRLASTRIFPAALWLACLICSFGDSSLKKAKFSNKEPMFFLMHLV